MFLLLASIIISLIYEAWDVLLILLMLTLFFEAKGRACLKYRGGCTLCERARQKRRATREKKNMSKKRACPDKGKKGKSSCTSVDRESAEEEIDHYLSDGFGYCTNC